MYQLEEEITTHYIDSPLSADKQYKIGDKVEIFELDTRQIIATFIVTHTDEFTAKGIINWIKD